jgi:hypothetical protein
LATVYVARSKTLSDWGYDVGLSKHIYKVGCADGDARAIVAAGWAGADDWVLVKRRDGVDGHTEADVLGKLSAKEKMLDPRLYPRLRDTPGVFKVLPIHVENQLLVSRAMAGESDLRAPKVTPAAIADYLIANGLE